MKSVYDEVEELWMAHACRGCIFLCLSARMRSENTE